MAFANGSPFSPLASTSPHQDPYTSWPEILKWVQKGYWWGLMDREQNCDPWKVVPSSLVFTGAREWRKSDLFPSFVLVWLYSLFALLFSENKTRNACFGFRWYFSIQLQYILKSGEKSSESSYPPWFLVLIRVFIFFCIVGISVGNREKLPQNILVRLPENDPCRVCSTFKHQVGGQPRRFPHHFPSLSFLPSSFDKLW